MSQDNGRQDGGEFTNGLAGVGPEHIRLILGTMEYLRQQEAPKPQPVRIEATGTYTAREVCKAWKMSRNTLDAWVNEGMPFLQRGTKPKHYYGAWLIEHRRQMVRQDPEPEKVAPELHSPRGAAKKRGK